MTETRKSAAASPEAGVRRAALACKQPNEGPVMLSVHVAGHEKRLFERPEDYEAYLERAGRVFGAAGVRVVGYLVTPRFAVWMTVEAEPLVESQYPSQVARKALKVIQEQYSREYNERYFGREGKVSAEVGAPWEFVLRAMKGVGMKRKEIRKLRAQARTPGEVRQHGENWMAHAPKVWLEAERVGEALRMVELLPQVLGLVERAEEYLYSSLRAHLGFVGNSFVDTVRFSEWLPEGWERGREVREVWREYVGVAQAEADKEDARRRTWWAPGMLPSGKARSERRAVRPAGSTGRVRQFWKAGVPGGLLAGGLGAESYCRVGLLEDLRWWWETVKLVLAERARRVAGAGMAVMGEGELGVGGMPS